jgi:aminocarboxymuconate-semialdehyde decarboxylase
MLRAGGKIRPDEVHQRADRPPLNALPDEMVKHAYAPEQEPSARFSNELSRATNAKQMQNVFTCLTSVEQRLSDMDKMGVDVQAISCSPFQFKYSLPPELGQQAARAINEHLASIVAQHPTRFVALANVPLQAPAAAAQELEYCVKTLGFRGVEIGTNVVGQEVSRGRDAFWAKVQELDVMVFMHPNGFTGGDRLADHYFINSIGNPLDSTVAVGHLVFDGVSSAFPSSRSSSPTAVATSHTIPGAWTMCGARGWTPAPRSRRSRASRWPSSTSTPSCSTANSSATS